MTEEQERFAEKYHFKLVKLTGNYFKQIPQKEYIVTSALFNWEGDVTIFALKALDYNLENKHWFTIKIAANEFREAMADVEIIEDGYKKYVKPTILDEVLMSWENQDEDFWTVRFSSYVFNEKRGTYVVPIKNVNRPVFAGLDEYMFIYKSILDVDKPSCYIIRIPNFTHREEVNKWVEPFREDVVNNKVAYGINSRFINKQS
jgi:hypothetical protein